MTQCDLSIIIVSRNVEELLQNCLQSLQYTIDKTRSEIIVVDNNSSDNTVQMVKSCYPEIKLIVNKQNVGFPRANNQAIPLTSGKYILFLNPDTIVHPDALQRMVDFMESRQDIGIIGPKIVTRSGSIQYDSARNFPDLWGCFTEISFLRRIFPKSRIFGHQYMTYWDHEDSRPVPCLVGAAMMVRRTAAESIGWYLDETIPMYLEDVDYCYRIHQAGWTVFYLSEAVIEHWGGASTERSLNRITYEILKWEAYKIFFERYHSKASVLLLRLMVFSISLLRIVSISIGIIARPVLPEKLKHLFSRYTLAKATALAAWSLNIRQYNWSLK